MATLSGLVADLVSDFVDEDGDPLVAEAYIERQGERSLPIVAIDIAVAYALSGDDVVPEMTGSHYEIWAIYSKILICRHLRTLSASRVNFTSGDKKMDRSKEAANWAALEKDLMKEYKSRVQRINPSADDTIISFDVSPAPYSRGAATE